MPSSRRSEADRSSRETSRAISRGWLTTFAVLLIVPWLAVSAVYFWPTLAGGAPTPVATGPDTAAAPGPWGRLTLVPIVISPPLELVTTDWGQVERPVWYFPGESADEVAGLLASAGIPASDVERARASAHSEPRIGGVVVTPDETWVRSLSPTARRSIYTHLAGTGLNGAQADAFRYRGTSTEAWLGPSLIRPETRRLVEPLVYRDESYLYFGDVDLIRSEIRDPEELRRLSKALLRQPTFIARLSVGASDSVDALAEYWGRGGRRTDIRPLLESVAGAGPDRDIDVTHLLPAFARSYLYRYPKLSAADFDRPVLANCLWTSLNFFRREPDDRFLDVDTALTTLKRDYYVVETGFELGDVVAFLDERGNIFHAAVYLADDLVFSKNGTSPMAPWTIMTIADVRGYYRTRSSNPRLIFHRLNEY